MFQNITEQASHIHTRRQSEEESDAGSYMWWLQMYWWLWSQERHGCQKCSFQHGDQVLVKFQKKTNLPLTYMWVTVMKKIQCVLDLYKRILFPICKRIKFCSQIIRNRVFIYMKNQWLFKYGESLKHCERLSSILKDV